MTHGGNVWQGEAPALWLDYSANLRPEGTPDWVMEALKAGMENARYYPDPEMRRATAALAEYLRLPAECVRPTAGGISAIALVSQLPSSETVILTPCFCEYAQFAQSPLRKVSLLCEVHGVDLPRELKLKAGSLVWLCNPMNPVGQGFAREEIVRLLKQVEAADGYLAVDEAFIEYCPELSAARLVLEHERLIITGSMTKILGIPGVRLGYLCAQPGLIETLKARQTTWELSCFAEAVACALPDHRAEIEADGEKNARRRQELTQGLQALGIFVYPSRSACVLADFGRGVEVIVKELKKRNILVRSCMNFDDIADGCHLRLAVKDEVSNRRLLEALKEAMQCAENH